MKNCYDLNLNLCDAKCFASFFCVFFQKSLTPPFIFTSSLLFNSFSLHLRELKALESKLIYSQNILNRHQVEVCT